MTTHEDGGDERQIRQLIEEWAAAVRRNDLAGVIKDHAEDILMFDLPGPTQTRGLDAYRESWPPLFEWFHGSGVFDLSELQITVDGRTAFATALILCKGADPRGEAVILTVRLTMGLRKPHDRWIVVHEHHSVPSE